MMKTAVILLALAVAVLGADECLRACQLINKPTCATFTKTYGNECQMKADACKLASQGYMLMSNLDGECSCDRPCPRDMRLACGSDGKTYDNECILNVEACKQGKWIEMLHEGPCQ